MTLVCCFFFLFFGCLGYIVYLLSRFRHVASPFPKIRAVGYRCTQGLVEFHGHGLAAMNGSEYPFRTSDPSPTIRFFPCFFIRSILGDITPLWWLLLMLARFHDSPETPATSNRQRTTSSGPRNHLLCCKSTIVSPPAPTPLLRRATTITSTPYEHPRCLVFILNILDIDSSKTNSPCKLGCIFLPVPPYLPISVPTSLEIHFAYFRMYLDIR